MRPGDPGKEGGGDLSLPQLSRCAFPKALKILQNTSSLLISESQPLQLLCVADSNPPAQLRWLQGSPALEAAPISSRGVLEIPHVGVGDGEVTCRAQNRLGSQNTSLSLIMVCEYGEPLGTGSWGSMEGRCTPDPSHVSPQLPRSCWAPPAPRRTRVCTAAAPPEPGRPPPCAGGSARGFWRGTSGTPPLRSPPASQGPGPMAP